MFEPKRVGSRGNLSCKLPSNLEAQLEKLCQDRLIDRAIAWRYWPNLLWSDSLVVTLVQAYLWVKHDILSSYNYPLVRIYSINNYNCYVSWLTKNLGHAHTLLLHFISMNVWSCSNRLYLGWFVLQVSIVTTRCVLSSARLRFDTSTTIANLATLPPCCKTNQSIATPSTTELPSLVSLPCPHSISNS